MKMLKWIRFMVCLTVLCSFLGITSAAADSSYEMQFMNGVKPAMLQADFWNVSDEVLMNREQIEQVNASNLANPDTHMVDLSAVAQVYDGLSMRNSLAGFENPKGLFLNGKKVEDSYYEKIRKNIANGSASSEMQTAYGFILNRTVMKDLPYGEELSDSDNDVEWDNLVSSAVMTNEPVTAYIKTADGKFTYVKSNICGGWIPTADLVLCHNKEEWLNAQKMDDFLIVTGDRIYLESSLADTATSGKALDMGTKLALAPAQGLIDNRMQWYNYLVLLPGVGADGYYTPNTALIPMNRDVHVGYLPMTSKNIVTQALKCIGDRYGWGGMLDGRDCSSYVREVYECFGLEIPRNTTWQSAMHCKVDEVKDLTDAEISAWLDHLPVGTILQFPGHEMLYLGKSGNDYYTINDVSSLIIDNPQGKAVRYRGRGVVINGLMDTKRANGHTWAQELTKAIVIWGSRGF